MQTVITRPQRLLRDGLLASAQQWPEKAAVVVEGKPYTYKELLQQSLSLADCLMKNGVKKGDRVAIYMDNTWPCTVSVYATLLVGGVFLVINPQTKQDKLEYVLNDSGAVALLSDAHLAFTFLPVLEKIKKLEFVVASGNIAEIKEKSNYIVSFDQAIEDYSMGQDDIVEVIPTDLVALIYTSGSTGFPKGVMHTHQSMVFAAWSLIEYQRLSETDKVLLVLPMAFDYGLYQLLMVVKLGATLIMERSFTFPAQIYKCLIEQEATVFPGVPTIFAMMIATHKKKALNFPTITRVTNTAAALPADFVPYLNQIFPNALVYKMYGLTECKRVSYLEPELVDSKPASVGKAIPGTEVYLLSQDGDPVPPNTPGILYVRGPHIMLGYWQQPQRSAEMLVPGKLPGETVLCTHDWFKMDEEGFLYFVGRSDDIIKTRGEKVSPLEVENVLHSIDGINEAVVIGVPDELFGQSIRAYVVLAQGSELNDKKIKKICLSKLENFMVPKDVTIKESFPKTANGKIDKTLLVRE